MAKCALTTFDNPFDPFDQFDQWFNFDVAKGYNSCSYLDRIARTSSQLSDQENEREIEGIVFEHFKKKAIMKVKNTTQTNVELIYEVTKKMFEDCNSSKIQKIGVKPCI